jgi:hypothetical protein
MIASVDADAKATWQEDTFVLSISQIFHDFHLDVMSLLGECRKP